MRRALRAVLRLLGKNELRVAAVFGLDPESCHTAVLHVHRGAHGVPIWLFTRIEPLPATRSLCDSVHVNPNPRALLWEAQRRLWPRWVAIGVTTWSGERGSWSLKLAPFLIPPFRALVLNRNGDFLSGTPALVIRQTGRTLLDVLRSKGIGERVYDRWFPALFQWLQGGQPLGIPPLPDAGNGVLRFRQKRWQWQGPDVERMLRASPARLLLWGEQDWTAEDIEGVLPLFDDPRTFAVSRQVDFRAWKPQMIPTAPFRDLQPGEASRVLAPLSPSVLVDCRKLLALGIPRCRLADTAWMVVFWRAAAAGWRCYSVGQAGEKGEQPHLPVQEASFLARFLFDRSLRRLGPREPDVSRGNIAFRIASPARAPRSGRLKVLLVSPFLPYPLSHGGAVRIYNLCRALADRVDFCLVAVREQQDVVDYPKLHEIFQEVYVVDRDERPSGDDGLPEQVRQYSTRGLKALVSELARSWNPGLLQVEYTHLAPLRGAALDIRAILVEHDLTFSLYRQLAERSGSPAARTEYRRWLDFERQWLEAYDAVWTVSEDDRQAAIREGSRHAGQTFSIPNGVDLDRYVPCGELVEDGEILFVGSFRHLPNTIGFEHLRADVMPRVWEVYPDARLRVVAGPQWEDFWGRFASMATPIDPRIEVHGFLADLRPLYARAAVVVVPLEVSAGTNIKVLEAMACGKAVVTTPAGCAGLGLRDGHDACIEAEWAAFAGRVTAFLSGSPAREQVAAAARRTAEERFSWKAAADAAHASYCQVLRQSKPVAGPTEDPESAASEFLTGRRRTTIP